MLQEVTPALWSTTKTGQSRIFPLLFQGSCLTYITTVYLTSHISIIQSTCVFLLQIFIVEVSAVG